MSLTETPAEAGEKTYEEQLEDARAAEAAAGTFDGGDAAPPPDEVVMAGTTQLGLFDAGGKKPTAATVTIRGKTFELQAGRAYEKGDRFEVHGVVVIDDIGQKDKRDKATGMVTDCVQRHSGFWEDLEVIPVVDGEP